jgi:predicted aldo/keto reductase-like oxidoreductase
MKYDTSRRDFFRVGLTLPVAGIAIPALGAAADSAAPLPFKTLGKTGLKVAPVGFGCGFTPDPSVIARAIDMGVNLFDTANDYSNGNSERLLAEGLKGRRDKAIVISKTPARNKAQAAADLDASLKNLQTDHLDVWLLHAKSTPQEVSDELLEHGETAKKQGKIRFYGFSTHDINQMADHAIQSKLDVIVFSYNFTMGTTKDAAIQRAHEAGIGLAAIKVMAATGGAPTFGRGGFGGARGGAAPVRPQRLQNPLPALKWVVRNPGVAAALPGIGDNDMLEMNFKAMTEKFTPEDERVLVARSEEVRPYYCRMCFQCTGQCPKGVPVADELRILAYADFYNDFLRARTHFEKLPPETQAIRCSDCAVCAVRCPNGVRVAERLIRAQEMLG